VDSQVLSAPSSTGPIVRPLLSNQASAALATWVSAVDELHSHVRRLYGERQHDEALQLLERVWLRLRKSGPLVIEPYGKFGMLDSLWVGDFLYSTAAQLRKWDIALAVADYHVELIGERKAGTWLQSRATCLVELGRSVEAKEMLLRNLDPRDPDGEVNRMLARIRERA
jgi:predicted Zn-dependent protease